MIQFLILTHISLKVILIDVPVREESQRAQHSSPGFVSLTFLHLEAIWLKVDFVPLRNVLVLGVGGYCLRTNCKSKKMD